MISALTRNLKPSIQVLEEDDWINDPNFAERAAALMLEMLAKPSSMAQKAGV